MPKMMLDERELHAFSRDFDTTREDTAVITRGQFLKAYPLSSLKGLTLDEYVIGKGTASFCARVEAKTRAWANILGATSNKFGIYYGKTKSDPEKKYRFTKKFGTSKKEAFDAVKAALLALVREGKAKNFQAVDQNPLSQMLKAKILSLYFPEIYINICSSEHLLQIASELQLPDDAFISEYQHLLYKEKLKSKITKEWSNPKFMSFLYAKFIREDLTAQVILGIREPSKRARRKVNFEDLQAIRDAIGKASEEFAIEWEKNRLIGLGYEALTDKIEDRRSTPSYGYDFLSFSAPGVDLHPKLTHLAG